MTEEAVKGRGAIRFRPYPAERIESWLDESLASYREDLERSGVDADEIETRVAATRERHFPGGELGPGLRLVEVLVDEQHAGRILSGPPTEEVPGDWFVWELWIEEPFRGRGAGRAAMLEVERIACEKDLTAIGLTVRADNLAARSLYEGLGYQLAQDLGGRVRLVKRLDRLP